MLRRSHAGGYIPIQTADGAGGISVQLCPDEEEWHEADFNAGDVLTFTSYTVHRALPSTTPELIRLSMDVRYQPRGDAIDDSSLRPHCDLDWDEIYAGWQSNRLKTARAGRRRESRRR